VRVEVDESERAVPLRERLDLRLRDRVVTAERDRQCPRVRNLARDRGDRSPARCRIGRDHRSVAEVDDPQLSERVDARLEVRPGRAARGPDRPRSEAGAWPVGDEVVHRRPDDRHVEPAELGRTLRVRRAGEREQPGIVGLVAERLPARERVDHGASGSITPRSSHGPYG
jgi:hypothetical protein